MGWLFKKTKNLEGISGKLSMASVALLLFLLGIDVGAKEEIRNHLDTLGLTGLLIAIFSIAGSLFFAWITWRIFYRKNGG